MKIMTLPQPDAVVTKTGLYITSNDKQLCGIDSCLDNSSEKVSKYLSAKFAFGGESMRKLRFVGLRNMIDNALVD
jgi:hypothetical protein